MKCDSQDWVQQVINATPGYERVVFERYWAQLFTFAQQNLPRYLARRVDADDVLQSVFRSFFRRNELNEFSFEESLDLWRLLVAITYRKICNTQAHHHAKRRDIFYDRNFDSESERAFEPGPEQLSDLFDMIDWVVAQLPSRYRLVLRMRLEGYQIVEIAEATSISERSVKRVLSRAKYLLAREH